MAAATGVLRCVEDALTTHFGHPPSRASVSFLGVEPIEILRYDAPAGEVAYASLGMARQPMTAAEQVVRTADGPRAELLLHLRNGPVAADAWRRLAVLAAAPAVEGVVYTTGMSVDLGEPFGPHSAITGVLVTDAGLAAVTTPDGPVDVLAALPATAAELAWARVHGGAALRQRWVEHATDCADLARAAVPLSG